jgi:hypothetical protein
VRAIVALLACAPAIVSAAAAGDGVLGVIDAPTFVQAVAPDGRWAVVCQARADTDGDGRLDVQVDLHGGTRGDRLDPYLVYGSGPGEQLDDFLGSDRTGRYIAALRHRRLYVDDTVNRRSLDLTALGAVAVLDEDRNVPPRPIPAFYGGRRSIHRDTGSCSR